MRRKAVAIVGYVFVGLALTTILLRALVAAGANQPFMGISYKHLPIGTYSTLAIFGVVGAVGVAVLLKKARAAWKSRPRN